MITVYFDRNVFADICEFRNGITSNDIYVIERAVKLKKIQIPLSTALLAEVAAVLQESNENFIRHIQTVVSLISDERFIKPPDELLEDDCFSYAYLAPFQRTLPISEQGKKFIKSPKINDVFLQVAKNHPKAIKVSVENINQAISFVRTNYEKNNAELTKDFVEVWEKYSIILLERLLTKLPAKVSYLCRKHGIRRMLKIRSIRLYTTYYAWILYSGIRGVQGQPRNLKSGDFMDFVHVIEASAAGILVTQEKRERANRIPFILNQIPFEDFEIMNVPEFVKFLQNI